MATIAFRRGDVLTYRFEPVEDDGTPTDLTKAEFLQACMATGLLDPQEAAVAAKGDIPAPFLPAVASMTPEQQDMLPVIWPAVTRINRMDPLILAVAKGARISEETLDALFGLTPTA